MRSFEVVERPLRVRMDARRSTACEVRSHEPATYFLVARPMTLGNSFPCCRRKTTPRVARNRASTMKAPPRAAQRRVRGRRESATRDPTNLPVVSMGSQGRRGGIVTPASVPGGGPKGRRRNGTALLRGRGALSRATRHGGRGYELSRRGTHNSGVLVERKQTKRGLLSSSCSVPSASPISIRGRMLLLNVGPCVL